MEYSAYVRFSSNHSLTHHGIKGQKWGIRRYQNKDGTLTAEGKRRSEKNELRGRKSVVIKQGKELYRVTDSNDPEKMLSDAVYISGSKKEHDEIYKNVLSTNAMYRTGKAYSASIVSNKDIILPSLKQQRKIELSLLKDKDTRKSIVDDMVNNGYSKEYAEKFTRPYSLGRDIGAKMFAAGYGLLILAGTGLMLKSSPFTAPNAVFAIAGLSPAIPFIWKSNSKNTIDRNINTILGDRKNIALRDALGKAAQKQGYNAIRDLNDRNNYLKAKDAIIIFNDGMLSVKDSHEITKEEYIDAASSRVKSKKDKMTARRVAGATYKRLHRDD